jgi:hypothetical protein
VERGEIVGSAKAGDSAGGWLVLDHIYADFVWGLSYQCNGCEIGLLLRSTKAGDGISGVYLPLSGPDAGLISRVTVDAQWRISSRKPFVATAPPRVGDLAVGSCAPIPCEGIRDAHGGSMSGTTAYPVEKITPRENDWNQVQVTMRGDVIIALVNGTRLGTVDWDGAISTGRWRYAWPQVRERAQAPKLASRTSRCWISRSEPQAFPPRSPVPAGASSSCPT